MKSRWGAMKVRDRLPLPDGYRVIAAGSRVRLFDPYGVLLQEEPRTPEAVAALQELAWRYAWSQLEAEIQGELEMLRESSRPLHEFKRLRQYMRLLDAVEHVPDVTHAPASRLVKAARLTAALAAAAAAVVIGATLLVDAPRVGRAPDDSTPRVATERRAPPAAAPAAQGATDRAAPAATRQPAGQATTTGRILAARPRVEPATAPTRRAITGYAVSVGEFATRAAAEVRMHLVRSKGYIVYVARVGETFRVVSRPQRYRERAEWLARALNDIGLDAEAAFVMVAEI